MRTARRRRRRRSTAKIRLENSTGGANYSISRLLHGNCEKKKRKHHKRRLSRDCSDKIGEGYPTTRFLEREITVTISQP